MGIICYVFAIQENIPLFARNKSVQFALEYLEGQAFGAILGEVCSAEEYTMSSRGVPGRLCAASIVKSRAFTAHLSLTVFPRWPFPETVALFFVFGTEMVLGRYLSNGESKV